MREFSPSFVAIRRAGTALLLVEQRIPVIQKVADRFLALRKGNLVHGGKVEELNSRAVRELVAL